jgi:hypothetical protein
VKACPCQQCRSRQADITEAYDRYRSNVPFHSHAPAEYRPKVWTSDLTHIAKRLFSHNRRNQSDERAYFESSLMQVLRKTGVISAQRRARRAAAPWLRGPASWTAAGVAATLACGNRRQ